MLGALPVFSNIMHVYCTVKCDVGNHNWGGSVVKSWGIVCDFSSASMGVCV